MLERKTLLRCVGLIQMICWQVRRSRTALSVLCVVLVFILMVFYDMPSSFDSGS